MIELTVNVLVVGFAVVMIVGGLIAAAVIFGGVINRGVL